MQLDVKTAYPWWYTIKGSNDTGGAGNVEKQEVWETYPGEGRAVGRSPARTPQL